MTNAEKILWGYLKAKPNGYKFRRQHPIRIYIADFYCHKLKLVIELDGSIHDIEEVKANDMIRQKMIEEEGITVMRFTNEEVMNNINQVLKIIHAKF